VNPLTLWVRAGRRRGLSAEHIFLLAVLGAASFFDGYDTSVKTLALSHIRESFDLTKAAASAMLAIIFLGALPAMIITRWADRFGRRRLLVWSIFGYIVFSGLTALAPDATTFTIMQFLQQVFVVAEGAIVWTMAAEELPADSRGFGFGVLAMNSALGVGFAAILWSILEPTGASWRWLYVASLPPLAFVGYLRRRLPESRRFLVAQEQGTLADRWHAIFAPAIRRWFVLIIVTTALIQLSQWAVNFTIDFLETERHLSSPTANLMLIAGGLPGIPIMVYAGALSDRFGRRLVGCAFGLAAVVGAVGFFWLPGGVPVLLPCMSLTIIGNLGSYPVLQTYTSELFPTGLRSSASAWANLASVAGRSVSLGLGALLLLRVSSSMTATLLGIGPLIAIVLIAITFPDTHGRELEDITGEPLEILPLH
jgi:MFS transporter, putative metabolite:H+ symporter